MSYVDAYYNKNKDIVQVAERVNGRRVLVEHRPIYEFYVQDPAGKHRSTTGDVVQQIRCKSNKEFRKNLAMYGHVQKYESDIKPLNKVLEQHYLNADAPRLHTAFYDIEVDFDPERGYASPEDAFMPITAIGVYLQWSETMICLAVPPKTLSWEQAEHIANSVPNVVLCRTEKQMLELFLEVIEDADVLSGWNSEGYDIPYTVNRIIQVLGKSELRKMCLWDQMPRERTYNSHGKDQQTYDLTGRIHLDYMQLYIKYNYEERHSYRLDYIGEMEVGERKVEYEGSLDKLYNHDFQKFLEYNIQDVMLLDKMDRKLQFIDLANSIAHDNTVLLPTVMGAVATTEQAVINEAHRRGYVLPDRRRDVEQDTRAAGAYVANPKRGMHEWVGSMDLNSLYPSVFRALNMAPETIVGQIRTELTDAEIEEKQRTQKMGFAEAWNGKFGTNEFELVMSKDVNTTLHLDMEDGTTHEVTGADVYNLVFCSGQPWNISANGTIFRTDFQGIIPGLLERWYAERKDMQAKKRESTEPADVAFWDKRQLVRKILLNSVYGALLNAGCRFYDKRIGQSTTLTGRRITRYMSAKTNELLTGEYDHTGKAIVYGDTDSVYFTAAPVLPEGQTLDLDSAVSLYDHVSGMVSDSFPDFMKTEFNVPKQNGAVIQAGREVVGRSGIFITKKRYAILVMDDEGKRPEGGKLKAMGLDLKRSDTPEFVQDFLVEVLKDALRDHTEQEIIAKIKEFKQRFREMPSWEKGVPKRVNNLTHYTEKYRQLYGMVDFKGKLSKAERAKELQRSKTIPGHVRASINWNILLDMHSDQYSSKITDGAKTIVCKLKSNPMGYTSVAYPIDQLQLPEWFKQLPFDDAGMEAGIVDKKIENLFGVLKWDLSQINVSEAMDEFFEF